MKSVIIKNRTFEIPEKYKLSKANRKLTIKTEFNTTIERVLKGDIQIQTQFFCLEKPRKSHKGLIEINREFFKIIKK